MAKKPGIVYKDPTPKQNSQVPKRGNAKPIGSPGYEHVTNPPKPKPRQPKSIVDLARQRQRGES